MKVKQKTAFTFMEYSMFGDEEGYCMVPARSNGEVYKKYATDGERLYHLVKNGAACTKHMFFAKSRDWERRGKEVPDEYAFALNSGRYAVMYVAVLDGRNNYSGDPFVTMADCVYDTSCDAVVYAEDVSPKSLAVYGNLMVSRSTGQVVYLPSMEVVAGGGDCRSLYVSANTGNYIIVCDNPQSSSRVFKIDKETGICESM